MTRIYMVRHGRATGGWDTAIDPSLDELGRSQAIEVANRLVPLGPLAIVSSPLARCQETASPLASRWNCKPIIDSRVAEIPSPEGYTMESRVGWLRNAMAGSWSELGSTYINYRDSVYECISHLDNDSVVFSHFVAINAVIGKTLGDDSVLIDSLDNCSVTIFERKSDGGLSIVQRGHQADTLIR